MPFKDNTKLAIIAGSGDLVLSCIKTCNKQNINIYLIGIDGFYENKNYMLRSHCNDLITLFKWCMTFWP